MSKRLLLALPLLLIAPVLSACGSDDPTATGAACVYTAGGSGGTATKPPKTPVTRKDLAAVLHLSVGDVPLTLHGASAPCTVNSFVSLARQGFFDKTLCHRLTTSGIFVLQCGDPTGTGTGGPGYSFPDELKGANALKEGPSGSGAKNYAEGTLAMANAGPDTNGSQFFLVYADSPLPPAYSVFGTIDPTGLKVLQAIADKGSDNSNGEGDGHPNEPVTITSVTTG